MCIVCIVSLAALYNMPLLGFDIGKPIITLLTEKKKADFHTPVFSSGYYIPSHITGNVSLGPKLGTIIISGATVIERGAHLTIEPGTTLAVNEYGSIIVRGSMEILGSHMEPIRFISNEMREENRTWSGILFSKGSSGTIQNTIFHHASPSISCAEETRVSISSTSFSLGNLDIFGSCKRNLVQVVTDSLQ